MYCAKHDTSGCGCKQIKDLENCYCSCHEPGYAKKIYAEGFAAAREKAAGIVQAHKWDRDKVSTVAVIDLIVNAIRAMQPDINITKGKIFNHRDGMAELDKFNDGK